jgi:hypothetical protein
MNMKKTLLIIIVGFLSLSTNKLKAQGAMEITPFVGYTFDDTFYPSSGGTAKINDGMIYGGILSVSVNPNYDFEFLYSRQEATGEYNSYGYYGFPISDNNIPLSVNYFMIGGNRLQSLGATDKFQGFAGMNFGGVLFSMQDKSYDDVWKFSFGFKLGVKAMFNDVVGIRLQTNLMMPIQSGGVGIYAGSGGVSTGVSTFSTITQFGFSGGLVFRVGQ